MWKKKEKYSAPRPGTVETYPDCVQRVAHDGANDIGDAGGGDLVSEETTCHLEGLLLLADRLHDLVGVDFGRAFVLDDFWSVNRHVSLGNCRSSQCLGQLERG